MVELLQVVVMRQLLAAERESAGHGCPCTDNVLQALDGEFVDAGEWQTISSGGIFQLVSSYLARLKNAKHFFGRFLDGWVEAAHPLLNGWSCPRFWAIVF